jgi:serine carboxypeptidase-like clade 2
VGNAVTDNELDNIGTVDFWWSHAIISDSLHRGILENCNFSRASGGSSSSDGDGDNDDDGGSSAAAAANPACARMLDAVNRQSGHIDPYNIYMSTCSDPLGHRSSSPQHFKYSVYNSLPFR